MTVGTALLGATLALPLAMLAGCVSGRVRERMPQFLPLAPLPALAAAIWSPGAPPLVLPEPPFRMNLALDLPGALLLGTAGFLWIAAGLQAAALVRNEPKRGRFAVWWLLILAGNLGVFIAADLVSFYLTYSVVSLAAYGLIAHDDNPGARRAGVIYAALAVLGEAFLLLGFVFMAAGPDGSLSIREAAATLPASHWRDAALALLVLGFGLKIGLVPGHVWMPLAYTAAPIPAAAALSGAAVKAGVIGFARFLPLGTSMPGWGYALAAVGIFSAFYGVLVGVTQQNPKTVLAYSSVSQMGLLAAVFGMGLTTGDAGTAYAASFAGAHHVIVKGALFLAIGVATTKGARFWPVLLPAGIIALGLAGLPLTGGALAKLAIKAPLGDGVVGTLATVSAAGSALLMLHFLSRLAATAPRPAEGPMSAALSVPFLATALGALVVPWALYPTPLDVLAPAALGAALWPVGAGAILFLSLRHWRDRLPHVPEGDIVTAGEAAVISVARWSAAVERADAYLRQWSVAVLSLLAVAVALGLAMLASR